jgi:hypothetical protein
MDHLNLEEPKKDRGLLRLPLLNLLNFPSRHGLLSNAKSNSILTDTLPFGGTCPPSQYVDDQNHLITEANLSCLSQLRIERNLLMRRETLKGDN